MGIKDLLGLSEKEKEHGGIGVSVGNVVLPLDMMIELIIRQQNQLFSENNELKGMLTTADQAMEAMAEQVIHMHADVVQMRQALEGAAQHPVEKVDRETEEKARPKKDLPN